MITEAVLADGTLQYAVQVAAGMLVLSGALHPAGPVDRAARRWHVALWDIVLVWGLLLAIAVVVGWRAQRESRYSAG